MKRLLFIDLEDTVIKPVLTGWYNTELINIDKVKSFIAKVQPSQVHIFSFAIHDVIQREHFNNALRPFLEETLGVKFTLVPTVDDDILPTCIKVMNLGNNSVDFDDLVCFWGKQGAFKLNMQHLAQTVLSGEANIEVILLDDCVFNETFEWPDLGVKGSIVNINSI